MKLYWQRNFKFVRRKFFLITVPGYKKMNWTVDSYVENSHDTKQLVGSVVRVDVPTPKLIYREVRIRTQSGGK